VSDTLSAPDPAAQVAEVRQIIQDRALHTCEATLLRIRRVVDPPPAEPEPPQLNSRGFPEMRPADPPEGTQWERHDDPTVE
jgi:predicted component of type VI protein secretion system